MSLAPAMGGFYVKGAHHRHEWWFACGGPKYMGHDNVLTFVIYAVLRGTQKSEIVVMKYVNERAQTQ